MEFRKNLSPAKSTNPITHRATMLTARFMQIIQSSHRLACLYFVKEMPIKKATAVRAFLMCRASAVFNTYFGKFPRTVHSSVLRLRNDLQILNGVIQRVSVHVMHHFQRERKKLSTKVLLQYKAVLWYAFTVDLKHSVSTFYRALSVQSSHIIRVSVSPLSLVVKATKTTTFVVMNATRYRTCFHTPTLSPFNTTCKLFPSFI